MTVDEIYATLAQHMLQGLMLHEQLANYYDFLGLKGYKRCHEYHFMQENCAYRGLCRYFINHHNKIIPYREVDDPHLIPDSWYRYTREEVDVSTKRNAVKNGLQKWVEWEHSTKELYEKMWKELIEIDEVASACKVKELITNVDCELKKAERYWLDKKAIDFSIDAIIAEQKPMHCKYKKKEQKIGVHIC